MKLLEKITFREPKSPVAEIYRALRTNIRYPSFEKEIKTIAITSTCVGKAKVP